MEPVFIFVVPRNDVDVFFFFFQRVYAHTDAGTVKTVESNSWRALSVAFTSKNTMNEKLYFLKKQKDFRF